MTGMWKRKSRRNRRLWHENYLLEVKTPFTKRFSREVQWASRVLPLIGALVISTLLIWGGWIVLSRRFLFENPNFVIRKIDVTTDGTLPVAELTRWSGVRCGQNLASVNAAAIKNRLQRVSWIREAKVTRAFPDRLVIHVSERTAVAKLMPQGTGGPLYFVDEEGVVFAALKGADGSVLAPPSTTQLPVVTGVAQNLITVGQQVRDGRVTKAIDAIRLCEKMGLKALLDLRGVDLSQKGTLKLGTGRGGAVYLNPEELDTQLKRLHVIAWRAKNERREIRTADLRPARNVAVSYF